MDAGAAFEILMDIASEPSVDTLQAITDAKTTYDFYKTPATIIADLKAGKLAAVTGPVARTLALADKLANDPKKAQHVLALVNSLTS